MKEIRKLPAEVVNRIAAGEVIERPASVLKELVENSIDAGATEIFVLLEEGGRKRVSVRDNGGGIPADELALALESHATSKVFEGDVEKNVFGSAALGFRGEALASIAAVSMLEIRSRSPRDEHASLFRLGDDQPKPCAGEIGTRVDVRDLFYNTPARRKFLKVAPTELSHCIKHVSRLAMSNPGIYFRLVHGERTVLELPATEELGTRLRQLLGKKTAADLLEVKFADMERDASLVGFVGKPSLRRRDSREQHFFVNGRCVRDRSLSFALRAAFEGFLIPGFHPVGYLFIDVPASDVDVNVHPTKAEVRFRDAQSINRLVRRGVRAALQRQLKPAADASPTEGEPVVETPATAPLRSEAEVIAAAAMTRPEAGVPSSGGGAGSSIVAPPAPPVTRQATFAPESAPDRARLPNVNPGAAASASAPSIADGFQPDPALLAEPLRVFQILNSYVVAEVPDGLILIDQHALHEKILFEEIFRQLESGAAVESQRFLVPEVVEVPPELAPLAEEAARLLGPLGFDVESFGPTSLAVHAVPGIFDREAGQADLQGTVRAVLRALESGELTAPAGTGETGAKEQQAQQALPASVREALRRVAAMMACKRAVKAGMPLSDAEMQSLLQRGTVADDPRNCPHGRPTAVFLSGRDIERRFDRK